MNDTSTKVFLALSKIADVVFKACYTIKDEPKKSINELLQKKSRCYYSNWLSLHCKLKKEHLEVIQDPNVSVGEFDNDFTMITIKANSFECSFRLCCVYSLLAKFAKLAREEKVLSNAQIKQYCTFERIFGLVEQTKQAESKVEQAKPVVLTIKVEQEQPKRTNNNPYNSDYAAMLAAQLSKLMSNYSVPF